MNDPMAVCLTLTIIALIMTADPGTGSGWNVAMSLLRQFGWGALLGILCGILMAALELRLPLEETGGGILALMLGSAGLGVFAATGLLGGSGFLVAVYLFGLVDLPTPNADAPVSVWLARALGRPAVVGDRYTVGPASFFVRAMDGSQITGVGLRLEDQALAPDR